MKLLVVLSLVALSLARPDDHYDLKYESFDVDELLNNIRLLEAYAHCFNGEGKCTPEGLELKPLIPEALQTSCGKCTDKQKTLVAKTMNGLKSKLPEEYGKLNKLHNPDGKYDAVIEEFLKTYGS